MHTQCTQQNTPQPMQLSKKYEGSHIRKAMGSNTKGLKIELEITLSVQNFSNGSKTILSNIRNLNWFRTDVKHFSILKEWFLSVLVLDHDHIWASKSSTVNTTIIISKVSSRNKSLIFSKLGSIRLSHSFYTIPFNERLMKVITPY